MKAQVEETMQPVSGSNVTLFLLTESHDSNKRNVHKYAFLFPTLLQFLMVADQTCGPPDI